MIRRPPTAIPLQQDDVHEMETFLAERRAAIEAAELEEAEAMQVEAQQEQQAGKGKGKSKGKTNGTKSKGKGKQRAEQANASDTLVESEEQARLARDAQTRDQRIGV